MKRTTKGNNYDIQRHTVTAWLYEVGDDFQNVLGHIGKVIKIEDKHHILVEYNQGD